MASDKLVPCLVHVPLQYPDGTEVEPEKLNLFWEVFDRQFHGCSLLGTIGGHWLDDGLPVVEPMERVEVSVPQSKVELFEAIAKAIGREKKQKAIYIVIDWQSETRILPLSYDDDNSPDIFSFGGPA